MVFFKIWKQSLKSRGLYATLLISTEVVRASWNFGLIDFAAKVV
jgi:hypothetical protein